MFHSRLIAGWSLRWLFTHTHPVNKNITQRLMSLPLSNECCLNALADRLTNDIQYCTVSWKPLLCRGKICWFAFVLSMFSLEEHLVCFLNNFGEVNIYKLSFHYHAEIKWFVILGTVQPITSALITNLYIFWSLGAVLREDSSAHCLSWTVASIAKHNILSF